MEKSGGSISVNDLILSGRSVAAMSAPSTPYEWARTWGRDESREVRSAASRSKSWSPGGLGG
jgi:hypothetical protein